MATPALSRRLQVTGLLAGCGALVGALTAVGLSFLATVVAQALTPTGRVEYFYSPTQFAILGAIGTPLLAWSLMRRVPLWRAISEPAIGGIIGTLVALATIPLLQAPLLPALCVPLGILGAALRLRWVHRASEGVELRSGTSGLPKVAS
jgi:hypothetical protein